MSASSLDGFAPEMMSLLERLISFRSLSGHEGPLTRFLASYASERDLLTDLWQSTEAEVAAVAPLPPRHIPLAGRPTLVISLPGSGPTLLFNAHSDVVPAPDEAAWTSPPFLASVREGHMFGRGACDTLGPLVSALWAMLALRDRAADSRPTVLLEIIPGEEDCVGLGTLTSVARGYRADAAVILEPTDGVPRCASRGGCRFEISITGRAIHGTVKWLGVDAIGIARRVLDALESIEDRWNDRAADPLFGMYPLARPVTPDRLDAGRWQGMVADEAMCAGYLELLPGDELGRMQSRFRDELLADVAARGVDPSRLRVSFSEVYSGHRTNPDLPLGVAARAAFEASSRSWPGWAGFNSGCEAGIRSTVHGTQTLVWGPGDLAHAHAADERVDLAQVRAVAGMFKRLAEIGHKGLS